jgi:hypothetical protein
MSHAIYKNGCTRDHVRVINCPTLPHIDQCGLQCEAILLTIDQTTVPAVGIPVWCYKSLIVQNVPSVDFFLNRLMMHMS